MSTKSEITVLGVVFTALGIVVCLHPDVVEIMAGVIVAFVFSLICAVLVMAGGATILGIGLFLFEEGTELAKRMYRKVSLWIFHRRLSATEHGKAYDRAMRGIR